MLFKMVFPGWVIRLYKTILLPLAVLHEENRPEEQEQLVSSLFHIFFGQFTKTYQPQQKMQHIGTYSNVACVQNVLLLAKFQTEPVTKENGRSPSLFTEELRRVFLQDAWWIVVSMVWQRGKHTAKWMKTQAIIILVIQSADEQRLVKKQANNPAPLFGLSI